MATAATFAAALIPIDADQAERLALQLSNCDGNLNRLLGELSAVFCNDQASADLKVAGRYQSALRIGDESLDERAFRLGLKAADLDAIAERHMDAAADAAGRAAGRRLRGWDDNLAASFDRECTSCTELALEASAEAERLRSQAAAIRRTAEPLSILSNQRAA